MIRAVVLDIEGTTSSLGHVRDVLFPYARERVPAWLARPDPRIARIAAEVRALTGRPAARPREITEILLAWIDRDVKAVPLKTLQGLIWEEGLAAGELSVHVYDDVPPVLRTWTRQGLRVAVYSSGSVRAQRAWFRHTRHGDLQPYISRNFDIPAAGPKAEAESYRVIARALALPEAEVAFLSDAPPELDAARTAGMSAIGVLRPGNDRTDLGEHPFIGTFDELDLTGGRPGPAGG
jgi:enolase-phosphatase E1